MRMPATAPLLLVDHPSCRRRGQEGMTNAKPCRPRRWWSPYELVPLRGRAPSPGHDPGFPGGWRKPVCPDPTAPGVGSLGRGGGGHRITHAGLVVPFGRHVEKIGKYEIVRVSAWGHGTVYEPRSPDQPEGRSEDHDPRAGREPRSQGRFLREAQAAASAPPEHRHRVQLGDSGSVRTSRMEFVEVRPGADHPQPGAVSSSGRSTCSADVDGWGPPSGRSSRDVKPATSRSRPMARSRSWTSGSPPAVSK